VNTPERGIAATKSSMDPRPVGAQPRAGGPCYEVASKLQRSHRKDPICRAGGSEVSFDPQPKAQAFADCTPSAQTPAPSAAGQTHHFSPRKA